MDIFDRNIFDYTGDYDVWKHHLEKIVLKRVKIKEEILEGGIDNLNYSLKELPNKYKIILETYSDLENQRYIDYLNVIILEDDKEIFSFIRNTDKISIIYVSYEQEDYLICTGESYMGVTIINLTRKTKYSVIPDYDTWIPDDIIQFDENEMELSVCGHDRGSCKTIRVFKINNLNWFGLDKFKEFKDV